jgi:hypothetical protein
MGMQILINSMGTVAQINKFYGDSGANINKFYGDSGANINKFYGDSGAN